MPSQAGGEGVHANRTNPAFGTTSMLAFLFFSSTMLCAQTPARGLLIPDPGAVLANVTASRFSLSNRALRVEWSISDGKIKFAE